MSGKISVRSNIRCSMINAIVSKMNSRFTVVMLASLVIGFCASSNCSAQVPEFDANQAEVNPGEVVRIEDQLMNGLRAVTPAQRVYIHQISTMVEQGQLPRAMVNVVYVWSLKRNPKLPLPYFQAALLALADRRGIALPPAPPLIPAE